MSSLYTPFVRPKLSFSSLKPAVDRMASTYVGYRNSKPYTRSGAVPNQTRTKRPTPSGEPPNQTKTKFPAKKTSSGGGSGGSGGGSGGGSRMVGGYSAIGAPTVSAGPDIWFPKDYTKVKAEKNQQLKKALAQIEQARRSAAAEKAKLDERYATKKDELRGEFQFAESAEEQAQIARILGNLEKQRDDGYAAIGAGYAAAIEKVEANSQLQSERSGAEAAAIAEFYNAAADGIAADQAAQNDRYAGFGVNADGGTTAGAEATSAVRGRAASEAALSQRMGELGAEDATWLASTMGGEREAHQADLGRLHMVTSASAQETHASRVQARIAQERAQWRDQLANLQQQFTQRGWQLGDQDRDLLLRAGDMRFKAGEALAQRRQSAAEANQRAAQARQAMQLDASKATASNRLQASIANASNSLSASKANQSARIASRRSTGGGGSGGSSGGSSSWMGAEERAIAGRIGMGNDLGPAYTNWAVENGLLDRSIFSSTGRTSSRLNAKQRNAVSRGVDPSRFR